MSSRGRTEAQAAQSVDRLSYTITMRLIIPARDALARPISPSAANELRDQPLGGGEFDQPLRTEMKQRKASTDSDPGTSRLMPFATRPTA